MKNTLTAHNDRMCPIYGKEIVGELCYETTLCMQEYFKLSSVPELADIVCDMDTARKTCIDCPHNDLH